MPASFTASLARRLNKLCAVEVLEVAEPVRLEPGHVYIGQGDRDLVVERRGESLMGMPTRSQPDYPWHPSTDRLVRTAREHVAAAQLVGVLLTGMGYDGAAAMAELRADGGRTIAESEASAVVWGMPGELVRAGGADFILPSEGIARQLQELTP